MAASCASKHHLVDRALRRRESAADRKGAGDVRGVVVVFAARIEQQQVAVAQRLIVVAVMHDAGIGAAADDRVIGNVGVVRAEFMQHLGHDLVLHAPGPREAHGAAVGADRDLRGAPQAGLLRHGSCRAACRRGHASAQRTRAGRSAP